MSQLLFGWLLHSEFWRKNDFLIDDERALPPREKRYVKAAGELSKHIDIFDLFPEYPYRNI